MNAKTLALLEFDKVRRQLAEHAAFSAGRQLALDLVPSTDPDEVKRRLRLTREARDFQDRRGGAELGGAHDVRLHVEAARRGKALLPQELLEIRDSITAARRLKRSLGRDASRWPTLAEVAERLEGCPALFDAIQEALDDNGEVQDSASPELRRVRRALRVARDRVMRQLESLIGQVAVREHLQEALITQRGGRYVLPVKSEFRSRVPGVVHDTSDSGATVFVEPLSIIEPGNNLRQLELEEEKEVDRVLRALSGYVAAEADAVVDSIEALAELDLAFACGEYAHRLKAVEPAVVEGERRVVVQAEDGGRRKRDPGQVRTEPVPPLLDFPRARHPLLHADTVVPIDVRVGEEFRLLVITGPNTGGKTVSLKTIGLLVVMAQSGLQIPAGEGARFTVMDGVFADIGDEQSIEQSLSTFSGHLTNIISILKAATDRSLVLLDELGAGTDPVEGAELAKAILEHLRAEGITTVASTHYSELKVYAHTTPGVANASVEFDVETLRPTYELTIGLPGRSNALAIAQRLGLPVAIIEVARAGLDTETVDMETMLTEIRDARRVAVADREAAADARRQADGWSVKLEAAVHEMEAERVQILNVARSQAKGEIEAARDAIAELERRAERAANQAKLAAAAALSSGEAAREAGEAVAAATQARRDVERLAGLITPEPEPEAPLPQGLDTLRPGRRVRVKSFNAEGEVVRLHGDEAEVLLGRIRLTVPLSDLEQVAQTGAPVISSDTTKVTRAMDARPNVGIEVDLRGMRVDEGLEELERYLSDALMSGLPWVRIVHGHGTGAMRQAVREALRHHPSVDRSRPGERGEGGDGATVAYLGD